MEKPNGDTPDQNKKPETPGSGTDTPPNKGGSSSADEQKNEVERERARAATALKDKEDAENRARTERIARIKAEKALAALGGGAGSGDGGGSAAPASTEEQNVRNDAEKRVFALVASTPAYQDVFTKDQTLKDIVLRNPLALISEYIDAEDAVDQIKKYLDTRLTTVAPVKAPETPSTQNPPAPGAGGGKESQTTYSAEAIRSMSPDQWMKIPQEIREKILRGETV